MGRSRRPRHLARGSGCFRRIPANEVPSSFGSSRQCTPRKSEDATGCSRTQLCRAPDAPQRCAGANALQPRRTGRSARTITITQHSGETHMLRTPIILSALVSVISLGHSVISAQAAGSPNIIQAGALTWAPAGTRCASGRSNRDALWQSFEKRSVCGAF